MPTDNIKPRLSGRGVRETSDSPDYQSLRVLVAKERQEEKLKAKEEHNRLCVPRRVRRRVAVGEARRNHERLARVRSFPESLVLCHSLVRSAASGPPFVSSATPPYPRRDRRTNSLAARILCVGAFGPSGV